MNIEQRHSYKYSSPQYTSVSGTARTKLSGHWVEGVNVINYCYFILDITKPIHFKIILFVGVGVQCISQTGHIQNNLKQECESITNEIF